MRKFVQLTKLGGYCDAIYSPNGYYCALDRINFHLVLFDDQAESPPRQIYLDFSGRFSSIERPYLIHFPKNPQILLIRYKTYEMGVFCFKKGEFIYHLPKIENLTSVVCRGKNTFIFLKKAAKQPGEVRAVQCRFVLEVFKLKNKVKDKFIMANRKQFEQPKLVTLGPRGEHLLVYTDDGAWRMDGRIYIFRLNSKGKLTYLSCIDFSSRCEPNLGQFNCLKFHSYMKTKMVFSGFSIGVDIGLFTVVYDFRSKKVVLVKFLKTKLSTVRNLSLIDSSLHGVDDYCKKFEVRI